MYGLLSILSRRDEGQDLLKAIRAAISRKQSLMVTGLAGTARAYLAAALCAQLDLPFCYICADTAAAETARHNLAQLLPETRVSLFPERTSLIFDVYAESPEILTARLSVLNELAGGARPSLVTHLSALRQRLMPREQFLRSLHTFRTGDRLDLRELADSLTRSGYERVPMVESRGQFAVRGGIVDLAPYLTPAVRIELFGDEIDSIRYFDLDSQRATEQITDVTLGPGVELLWEDPQAERPIAQIQGELTAQLPALSEAAQDQLRGRTERDLERLRVGHSGRGLEKYAPYFFDDTTTLLDYLPEGTVVFLEEPVAIGQEEESIETGEAGEWESLISDGLALPGQKRVYLEVSEVSRRIAARHPLQLAFLPRRAAHFPIEGEVGVLSRSVVNFHGQIDLLEKEIRRHAGTGAAVVLLGDSSERRQHIVSYLEQGKVRPRIIDDSQLEPVGGQITVFPGAISNGFELPGIGLVVVAESDIYPAQSQRRPAVKAQDPGTKILNFRDLKPGDYVVHVNQGIAQYMGIRTMTAGGVTRDYLELRYSGADKLYVPVEQLGLLQKYVGAEGRAPKLHSLGSGDWQRVKARVSKSVEDMAERLLAIYAARYQAEGIRFTADNEWQREMEASFPYDETPDQITAITAIKSDMETAKPMDRLLCGDVGYGKTEVAVRAAFKAVMSGYQVAFLAPTTILAEQHLQTLRERFGAFPVRTEMVSRFRTREINHETLARVRRGEIDVIVGTHRLLQKDVVFNRLGLIIVDEEQRFGVKDKERLKEMQADADVLTLTATPIPRTLHMAMAGIRDMSVIETPPLDRYPVQTYVVAHNDAIVRYAVERELARGGQVYYLHNRVRSIHAVAARIEQMFPQARVAVGHGQMTDDKLERIMLDFMEHKSDILVCTTIVESGLDIPNVNTIIIEEADRFGLAQLYQMRGRVGRSTRVGYAYLTYRYDKNLTEEASRRLQAIKEFTELGSGFKIAMRDLEIRGAGNVLGAEQHGFMLEVGFDLYCQMLEEAVARLKGKPQSRRVESEIKISIDAFIPDYYIPEAGQKLAMYKRLAALNDPGDLEDVLDELIDRYGAPPRSVLDLIAVTRLRISASQAGVASVNEQRSEWVVQFIPERFVEPAALQKLPAEMLRRIQLRPGGAAFRFSWAIAGEPASVCAENLAKFLGLVTEGFHHGEDALMGSNADSIPG